MGCSICELELKKSFVNIQRNEDPDRKKRKVQEIKEERETQA